MTRKLLIAALAIGFGTALGAQKNTTVPQPRADRLPPVSAAKPSRGREVPKPATMFPTAPAGFTVTQYAELEAPRMMVYAPNGDLFVSSPEASSITVFRDANNDGTFEARGVYADKAMYPAPANTSGRGAQAPAVEGPASVNGPVMGAKAPACAPPPMFNIRGPGGIDAPFGMAFQGGYLYVGNTGSIVRFRYTNGDMKASAAPEKLLELPVGGHSTRNIVFNRAGTKMYIAVGSQSNNNAGEDCRRAAVLEFNPDGSGYRVFASGIRNPVGLTLQPGTDIPWVAVNERDNLGDDLVPDYATSLKDGGFYGWPYSYIGANYDPRYAGAFPDLVKRAIVPDVLIPAHSAALGIAFYTGMQFPQKYRGGAFVALHGSWNRSVASGYKVAFFPMVNGKPGPLEDFLTGFLVEDNSGGEGISRWGRPVGVTVARDGALLVSDDGGNRIWKVAATSR
jgi:glucose/arabinose dehydrogenase